MRFLFFNNFRQIKHARNRIMSFRDFFLRCSEGPEWLFATKKQHQHQQLSSSSSSNQSLITKARIIWSALHLTLLHLLLALGNETTRVPFPSAFERALFLFAIVMNALAYFVVSFSSPGFVTPPLGAFSNSGSRKSGLMFADKEDHHHQREMTTMGFSSSEGGNGDEETASIENACTAIRQCSNQSERNIASRAIDASGSSITTVTGLATASGRRITGSFWCF